LYLPEIQKNIPEPRTTTDRKVQAKIFQRIGITYLPKMGATWRYQINITSFLGKAGKEGSEKGEGEEESEGEKEGE
jgi:hypothetical protein